LFAAGVQSAFFGPLKYGILPQLLDEDDLVGGNALVEMGTSLAILLGTLAGGLLFELGPRGPGVTGACLLALAVLGWGASLLVPAVRSENPGLRLSRDPLAPTLAILRISAANRAVYLSVLAISWFWFFGVAVLALLPAYSRDALGGGPGGITFFLALFCVGNGVGSLRCERLSGRRGAPRAGPAGAVGLAPGRAVRGAGRARGRARAARRAARRAHRRRLRAARGLVRALRRAALRARPAALGAEPALACDRGQQHHRCALHGGVVAADGRA